MGTNQRASIVMTEDEVTQFLTEERTATLATVGPSGAPHLIAMWYALLDGQLWFETKAKSQKAVNLRRNPTVSCMVEAGRTYDSLRGVAIEGTARILDDAESIHRVGVGIWERYNGPYSDEMEPYVAAMMNKRVVVVIDAQRTRSWDHRKLGIDPMPYAGSTATDNTGGER